MPGSASVVISNAWHKVSKTSLSNKCFDSDTTFMKQTPKTRKNDKTPASNEHATAPPAVVDDALAGVDNLSLDMSLGLFESPPASIFELSLLTGEALADIEFGEQEDQNDDALPNFAVQTPLSPLLPILVPPSESKAEDDLLYPNEPHVYGYEGQDALHESLELSFPSQIMQASSFGFGDYVPLSPPPAEPIEFTPIYEPNGYAGVDEHIASGTNDDWFPSFSDGLVGESSKYGFGVHLDAGLHDHDVDESQAHLSSGVPLFASWDAPFSPR